MRRRNHPTPLDLIPIMGLMTLLIPLLLVNQSSGVAFATVDADLPTTCACGSVHDAHVDPPLIPSVSLGLEHIVVDAVGQTTFDAGDLPGLSEHLETLQRENHTTGRAIIVTDGAVRYEALIAVMDTVRPHFPASTLAAGAL